MMRQLPVGADGSISLEGKVYLNHSYDKHPTINNVVELKIIIPKSYPCEPIKFEEVGGLIPKSPDYHVNPDGSLCLGSPFKVMKALRLNADLNTFFESFFIPYIYAVILKIEHNINFIFGELSHGTTGEVEDLEEIFAVSGKDKVLACLDALAMKKRIANKRPCPCDCNTRLGRCSTRFAINPQRKIFPRSWYRALRIKLS